MEYKNIALGFINSTKKWFGIANDVIEDLAIDRYEQCLQCPLISESKSKCTVCGCNLSFKVRSNAGCPEKKW